MHAYRPDDLNMITVLDLFSGCGGFTQGFHEFRPEGAEGTGPVFRSIAAVEHNAAAAATYAVNFGSERLDKELPAARVHFGDIEKWEPTEDDLHADVVVGGPPCQGFSALNRNRKGTERNRLWEEYVRIVARVRPKVFVIENVDRFLKSDEFRNLLSEVREGGKLADYRLVDPPGHVPGETEDQKIKRYLLNAADYGAAQSRRRTIVIGVRRDIDNVRAMSYPAPMLRRRPKNGMDAAAQTLDGVGAEIGYWKPVDEIFKESEKIPLTGTELPDGKKYIEDIDVNVPGIFTTEDLHFKRQPKQLSLARYRAIPEGGNRKDLEGKWYTLDEDGVFQFYSVPSPVGVKTAVEYLSTESWDNHTTGTGDVMGRLRLGEPSVTIRTEFFKPEKGRYLHPTEPRPITHFEAARIQGFPREFRWCGSKTEIAKQIGNAVPIPLGKAVASAIFDCLRRQSN
ncbi:DNA (cytosine-5)-methyltransferase 1 [Streptomyces sp. TLI_55]|uniref:DNA cytosine methyltransferase n=1 Tax=Streptomyces sp. TLI_55 TaxID=1938861 RepID=UPI000BCB6C3D|nr:DNA cytosine methyltransferase [Streptomyces sp. TLI_55]SNX61276.1 DNA (cytosine-5)-methyltransferase 1 [Streptomyces sp. TLI_55]